MVSPIYFNGKFDKLNSIQDAIKNAAWYRGSQREVFTMLINLYSAALSVEPSLMTTIKPMVDNYLDVILPGSLKKKKEEENSLVSKNAALLDTIQFIISPTVQGNKDATKKAEILSKALTKVDRQNVG